jgi:hypothetical protein
MAPATACPSSVATSSLRRHSSEVGAVCGSAARTDLYGLCLQAHGIQSLEMETAAKPSSQPRTMSCVMFGDGHCEA